jgi:hypothetical protein
MFGMNVIAQDTRCKVNVIITLINTSQVSKVMGSESKSIDANDVERNGKVNIYSLNPSQDYMFIFSDDTVEKIFMIKTSNVCGNILDVDVDMSRHGSLTSVWRNGKYHHEFFNDLEYKK